MNWNRVRLGDLTKIKTGKLDANASSSDGRYPFFTCAREPLRIATYSYDCECVLVAGNGDLNVKYYNGKFDAYQRTYIIESNDAYTLDARYLYHFLDGYVETLRELSIGGIIKYIKLGNLTEALIPLPELGTQQYIVEILGRVEGLILLRKRYLETLDFLVKSRFVEMFGSYNSNPNRFLQDVSEFVTVGIANAATHAYADTGVVMLRNLNVRENYLDDTDLVYIKPDFAAKYHKKALKANDILVTRTGYPGIACVVPEKYESCQTFTTLIVRLKEDAPVTATYVSQLINSPLGKEFVEKMKAGSSQQNFGATSLKLMPIGAPPLDLQQEFAAFVQQVEKSKAAVRRAIEKLELLKASLMQEYFGPM